MSNKNTIKKKKIHKDCYALDYSWLIWLKERLPVYLHDSSIMVNLEYHVLTYKDKEYTQKEAIHKMIELVDYLTSDSVDDWSEEYNKKYDMLFDLWKIWARCLWW